MWAEPRFSSANRVLAVALPLTLTPSQPLPHLGGTLPNLVVWTSHVAGPLAKPCSHQGPLLALYMPTMVALAKGYKNLPKEKLTKEC
jgi:hypothetical protein